MVDAGSRGDGLRLADCGWIVLFTRRCAGVVRPIFSVSYSDAHEYAKTHRDHYTNADSYTHAHAQPDCASIEGTAVHAADAWTNLLTESFDSNQFGWHVGKDDDEYALTNFEVRDGKYIWDATAHQGFVQRIRANASAIKDFYFSVEITQPESLVDVDYGIYFREDQEDNYYYFGMDNNGEFILWLYNNEEWTQLVEETLSPAFQQGETNKLSMIAEEKHFIFFINDEFAVECFDETLAAGNVSMVIEISQPNLHAIFEFDNVIVHLKK